MERGTVVEAKSAGYPVKAARLLVPLLTAWTRWRRGAKSPLGGIEEHVYGADPREKLTYLAAPPAAPRRSSAVVYVHGGGWIAGHKDGYTPYLGFLRDAGYRVFNLGYPLAPEHPHPAILRSLLRALDWIASSKDAPSSIHLMGDSAGGNLAMMLGLLLHEPERIREIDPERAGPPALRCASVVSLYGVLDRLSWIEDEFPGAKMMLESYGGKGAFEPEVPASLALTPMDLDFDSAPPSFLAVGTEDPLRRSSQIFADRLAGAETRVVHREYPGEGHGFLNLGSTRSDILLQQDVLSFLESVDA
jgi:acetyl esterase/lipase